LQVWFLEVSFLIYCFHLATGFCQDIQHSNTQHDDIRHKRLNYTRPITLFTVILEFCWVTDWCHYSEWCFALCVFILSTPMLSQIGRTVYAFVWLCSVESCYTEWHHSEWYYAMCVFILSTAMLSQIGRTV